ncbi:cytochrome o ubiquinol oxidase subunit IV [Marinimicrobium agarilyticum]|uniref:cytochrome o ubiquinol oxidase subunit IV n=1 Tax=Marinimicrobium agarilyticum TaxID=306546 RepID=UPI000687EFBE|nr:cytochrome o ubiquinol oxidase subunit IV [Marinimicrobium agarilyticum]
MEKARDPLPESEAGDPRREFREYCIGGALALLLTCLAFALVASQWLGTTACLITLSGLALAQMLVQFRYFLHIDIHRSHRDELQLILFTGLIILLMVGGTIWILWNLHSRM